MRKYAFVSAWICLMTGILGAFIWSEVFAYNDHDEIQKVITEYHEAPAIHNFDALERIFAEEVDLELRNDRSTLSKYELVARLREHSYLGSVIGTEMVSIKVLSGNATVITKEKQKIIGDADVMQTEHQGLYSYSLVKSSGRWVISKIRLSDAL